MRDNFVYFLVRFLLSLVFEDILRKKFEDIAEDFSENPMETFLLTFVKVNTMESIDFDRVIHEYDQEMHCSMSKFHSIANEEESIPEDEEKKSPHFKRKKSMSIDLLYFRWFVNVQ